MLVRRPERIAGTLSLLLLVTTGMPRGSAAFELKANLGAGCAADFEADTAQTGLAAVIEITSHFLWGPSADGGWAAGPMVAVFTEDFYNIGASAAGSLLIPASRRFPLVFSAGGFYLKEQEDDHSAGVLFRLWWGLHSRNLQSVYVGSVGLFAESRVGLWRDDHIVAVVGIDLDALTLFGPLLAL